jgi:hypothetical protein
MDDIVRARVPIVMPAGMPIVFAGPIRSVVVIMGTCCLRERLTINFYVMKLDELAAFAVSDCAAFSHAPGDKVPRVSSGRCRAHRCGPFC